MLFSDFRLMLRAPFECIEGGLRNTGLNFSAYLLGIHILEGLSVIFSEDPISALKRRAKRRKLFIRFVAKYYPEENEQDYPKGNMQKWNIPEKEKKAELLYDARNPLVHALGAALDGSKCITYILKNGLSPDEISKLERGERPKFPTINLRNNYCDIHVPALYWGIYRSLEKLFQDEERMEKLNKFLSCS
jgi:hypothetical protein